MRVLGPEKPRDPIADVCVRDRSFPAKKRTDGDLLRGESNFVVGDCRWLPDSDCKLRREAFLKTF
jgi:hypothetical protein